jgi:hypothetical protein
MDEVKRNAIIIAVVGGICLLCFSIIVIIIRQKTKRYVHNHFINRNNQPRIDMHLDEEFDQSFQDKIERHKEIYSDEETEQTTTVATKLFDEVEVVY